MVAVLAAGDIRPKPADNAPLFDFVAGVSNGSYSFSGGTAAIREGALRLDIPPAKPAALRLTPAAGFWDLSPYTSVAFSMRNSGKARAHYRCKVGNEDATDWGNSVSTEGVLAPGEHKTFHTVLYRHRDDLKNFPSLQELSGMNGLPGGFLGHWRTIQPERVVFVQLSFLASPESQHIEIQRVTGAGRIQLPDPAHGVTNFFPFVDEFGQYRHARWVGKIRDEADLRKLARTEADDLRVNPSPAGRNRYGGWSDGPRLEATGHFRTVKHAGYWWLVDPDGCLFWSLGVNSANPHGSATRVTGRKHYFQWMPVQGDPMAAYLGREQGNVSFDFVSANRHRKFGPEWREASSLLIHDRMHSWGINTLGAWSAPDVFQLRRTPYTVIVSAGAPRIGRKTPDPFSRGFRENLRRNLAAEALKSGDDPWCIGYFIENELDWHRPRELVSLILEQPAHTATRQALLSFVQQQYRAVEGLNTRWKTQFSSWEDFRARAAVPTETIDEAEFVPFYAHFLETWYRTCQEEMRAAARNKLFLGSRFHKHTDTLIQVAAKYCDVLSYNLYRTGLSGFSLRGVDKPILSSEFSFGALDRGMFWTGLGPASDQQDRAALLTNYIRTALENPNMVGVHWFAYNSQPITGRSDGENGQIGLVDICDTPYEETITALRDISGQFYQIRSAKRVASRAEAGNQD
jgi:hypothetical protein